MTRSEGEATRRTVFPLQESCWWGAGTIGASTSASPASALHQPNRSCWDVTNVIYLIFIHMLTPWHQSTIVDKLSCPTGWITLPATSTCGHDACWRVAITQPSPPQSYQDRSRQYGFALLFLQTPKTAKSRPNQRPRRIPA